MSKDDEHATPTARSTTRRSNIRLCGVQGCCPVVSIDHDERKLVITDDDGGKVQLTEEQWLAAVQNVKF